MKNNEKFSEIGMKKPKQTEILKLKNTMNRILKM